MANNNGSHNNSPFDILHGSSFDIQSNNTSMYTNSNITTGTPFYGRDGKMYYPITSKDEAVKNGLSVVANYMNYCVDEDGNVVTIAYAKSGNAFSNNNDKDSNNNDEDQYGTNDDAGLKKDAVASKMQKLKNTKTISQSP